MVLLWLMLSFGACSPQVRHSFPGLSAVSHELACPVDKADELPSDQWEPEHQPATSPEQRPPQRKRTAEPPEWEI